MSEAFDPEKVERFDCELGSHYYGEPLAEMVDGSEYIRAADYDKLLALYREAAKEIADWRHEARC